MPTVEYLNYDVLEDYGWSIDDDDLFEKAEQAELNDRDHGFCEVDEGEYILQSVEAHGHEWPFSCRDGICSNCAAIVSQGEIEMHGNQVLTEEEIGEKNVRLTCIGTPASDFLRIIYNVKQLEFLQDRVIY